MAITLIGLHRVEMISNLKSNALFWDDFKKLIKIVINIYRIYKKFLQQIGKVALEKYVQKWHCWFGKTVCFCVKEYMVGAYIILQYIQNSFVKFRVRLGYNIFLQIACNLAHLKMVFIGPKYAIMLIQRFML